MKFKLKLKFFGMSLVVLFTAFCHILMELESQLDWCAIISKHSEFGAGMNNVRLKCS